MPIRPSFRNDLIAAYDAPDFRIDAPEAVHVENELLQIRTRLYEVRHPELRAMDFVPPEGERLDPGANHFAYEFVTHYGAAPSLHTGMSQRGPRAQVKKERATPIPFVSKTNSYGYSVQDIRATVRSGFPLPFELAAAARKAMSFWHDDVLLIGDGTATWDFCTGLFMLSGIGEYTTPVGVAGDTEWETKTSAEILADMHGVCNKIVVDTNGVENPDTLILPLSSYMIAATQRMSESDARTILETFLAVRTKMRPGFRVEASTKCESISSAKQALAYERSSEKVARLDSVEFEQMQPQIVAFETITDCHMRTAGVYTPYPKSLCKMRNI